MDDLMELLGYPGDTPIPVTLGPQASLRVQEIIADIRELEATIDDTVRDSVATSLGTMDLDPTKAYVLQTTQITKLIRRLSQVSGIPLASSVAMPWVVFP